jgi:hypothetical protein
MNARTAPDRTASASTAAAPAGAPNTAPAPPSPPGSARGSGRATTALPARFDARFIEEHQLIERYLEGKLPFKGARDLEEWCRSHPEYLSRLRLAERAQASLKLLEAIGQAPDLGEPAMPWWRSIYVPIALGVIALVSLTAFWVLIGKYALLRGELEDTQLRLKQGPLVQPAVERLVRITPDKAPGINQARIVVKSTEPQLVDLHIDLAYTGKLMQYRLIVDKLEQGRALVLNNLLRDSNNELRLTFNTTGLSRGTYGVRIEALPPKGALPIEEGWLTLEVQ